MKEILYKYNSRGMYTTQDDTSFGEAEQMKLIVEPHDFSLRIGDDVLRSTSCGAYTVLVSDKGEAAFYDSENDLICKTEQGEKTYKSIKLSWKQDYITVEFGKTVEVDNYPNCDGEYDRWSREWVAEHSVILNLKDGSAEIL